MNAKLLILYGGIKTKSFEIADPKYRESYEIITSLANERGTDIFFSGMAYWDGKKFRKANYYSPAKKSWTYTKNIKPDLVFDKITTSFFNVALKRDLEKRIPVLNPSLFDLICNNKFLNYLIFEDLYPRSFLVSNVRELRSRLNHIETNKVVIKPTIGTCGKNVEIMDRKKIKKIGIKNDHFLLQEFIDSSRGIPNVIKGTHDLRITIIDSKIIYAYLRTPPKGSLLCNIALGGKMKNIKNSEIPKEARIACRKIMEKLTPFENLVYSIDMALDKDRKMKVVEMNSRPGVYFYPKDRKTRNRYYNVLIDNFINYLKKIK
jgi:glutathione synthase/RimK-type ligase-like ATP-grasp enzyme